MFYATPDLREDTSSTTKIVTLMAGGILKPSLYLLNEWAYNEVAMEMLLEEL